MLIASRAHSLAFIQVRRYRRLIKEKFFECGGNLDSTGVPESRASRGDASNGELSRRLSQVEHDGVIERLRMDAENRNPMSAVSEASSAGSGASGSRLSAAAAHMAKPTDDVFFRYAGEFSFIKNTERERRHSHQMVNDKVLNKAEKQLYSQDNVNAHYNNPKAYQRRTTHLGMVSEVELRAEADRLEEFLQFQLGQNTTDIANKKGASAAMVKGRRKSDVGTAELRGEFVSRIQSQKQPDHLPREYGPADTALAAGFVPAVESEKQVPDEQELSSEADRINGRLSFMLGGNTASPKQKYKSDPGHGDIGMEMLHKETVQRRTSKLPDYQEIPARAEVLEESAITDPTPEEVRRLEAIALGDRRDSLPASRKGSLSNSNGTMNVGEALRVVRRSSADSISAKVAPAPEVAPLAG